MAPVWRTRLLRSVGWLGWPLAALALLAAGLPHGGDRPPPVASTPAQDGAVQEHPQPSALSPQPVAPAPAQDGALQVRVGVYLLSVNRLDTSLGSYALDFYLSFRCDRPCDPSEFEFINGHATASVPEEDTPVYKAFRVQAELAENLDLRAYPFDRHTLVLTLEDRVQTREALTYVVDREHTALDPNLILPGWTLDGSWSAAVTEKSYPIFDQTYSHYTFSIEIHRPVSSALLKGVAPAVLIVFVGFLALVIGPESVIQRLALGTSALISSVLYHLTFTAAVPAVPYMTFADRLMVVNYGALTLVLASTVAILVLHDRQHERTARRVQWLALIGIPTLWLALQALTVVTLRAS